MSRKIYGNIAPQLIDNIAVINNKTIVKDVSVNIPSYLNRKTRSGTLKRYLNARGNKFDRGLWQPALVAELPSGEQYLFDGDHRRALWEMAYPQKTTMPAQIIPVNDESEISRLFVAINKTARTALKPNEVFVHEVNGGIPEAVRTSKHLDSCGLSVSLGTGKPGSTVGNPEGPQVNIDGFRKSIRENSIESMESASKTIQSLWSEDRRMYIELLGGLAKMYKNTPVLAKHKNHFDDFMKSCSDLFSQRDAAKAFKEEGGNKVNHHERCVTLGILLRFKKWAVDRKGRMSKGTFYKYYSEHIKNIEAQLSI